MEKKKEKPKRRHRKSHQPPCKTVTHTNDRNPTLTTNVKAACWKSFCHIARLAVCILLLSWQYLYVCTEIVMCMCSYMYVYADMEVYCLIKKNLCFNEMNKQFLYRPMNIRRNTPPTVSQRMKNKCNIGSQKAEAEAGNTTHNTHTVL